MQRLEGTYPAIEGLVYGSRARRPQAGCGYEQRAALTVAAYMRKAERALDEARLLLRDKNTEGACSRASTPTAFTEVIEL